MSSRRNAPSNLAVRKFRSVVVKYWKKEGRHSLPWRQTRDPYKILVSEIMLQQTQVDRVIPLYTAFLKKFPTVRVLADSPLSDVLIAWQGLGYNRRAKMLRETARVVVEKYGGTVPKDRAALETLPGVGPYTAGAIRAFAFNIPDVFVETNIRATLIHHFFTAAKKVEDAKIVPILQALLADIESPREWYSALMDYGAHLKATFPNPSRRSAHHSRQSRFDGSLRQARGVIIHVLAHSPVSEKKLPRDSQTRSAIAQLLRERMIERSEGSVRLSRQ